MKQFLITRVSFLLIKTIFSPARWLWRFILYLFNLLTVIIVIIWNCTVWLYDKWHETHAAQAALRDYERQVAQSDFSQQKQSISQKVVELCEPLLHCNLRISHVNFVVSGGAANNVYAWGVAMVCRKLGIKFSKSAGSSSGALMAFLAISDVNVMDTILFETVASTLPSIWRNLPFLCLGPVYKRALEMIVKDLPLPDNDRLFITVTNYFKAKYISRFSNKKELTNALVDTALIPGITGIPRFSNSYVANGKLVSSQNRISFHMDGGFADLAPVSAIPESSLPTIVVNPFWSDLTIFQYIKRGLFPSAEDMEKSILLGAIDMIQLLQSRKSSLKGITLIEKSRISNAA